jgi:hypothetical protein
VTATLPVAAAGDAETSSNSSRPPSRRARADTRDARPSLTCTGFIHGRAGVESFEYNQHHDSPGNLRNPAAGIRTSTGAWMLMRSQQLHRAMAVATPRSTTRGSDSCASNICHHSRSTRSTRRSNPRITLTLTTTLLHPEPEGRVTTRSSCAGALEALQRRQAAAHVAVMNSMFESH